MTAFIGITQDMAAAEEKLSSQINEPMGEKTVVGPFASYEAASEWLQFMLNRSTDYQSLNMPANSDTNTEWYGLTFEQALEH